MRNKFEGVCYLCNLAVKIGEGHFQKQRGKFLVKHALYTSAGAKTCEEARSESVKLTKLVNFYQTKE